MKDRLLAARLRSESLADAACGFRYSIMLLRINRYCIEDLKSSFAQFDQVLDAWKSEMEEGVGDALEFASPGPFEGVDSITRDYILEIVVAIRSSLVCLFPDEVLLGLNSTDGFTEGLSWLWRTAEKHNCVSPKLIEERLKVACVIACDAEKRKRIRREFNAAIRSEIQSTTIVAPQMSNKTTSVMMMEKIFQRPAAMGWSLKEWVSETNVKKTTISSCIAYKSQLLKTARECRKAIGVEAFEKDARLLFGEKRRD